MKYRTIEGGYKVPVYTKEWKAMWFVLGMFFRYLLRYPIPANQDGEGSRGDMGNTRLICDGRHPSMC